MAVNYDEKILSSVGKKSGKDGAAPENGVFIVDPNKLVVDSYDGSFIKDRYVPQEDLVMYANITARMAPDNHILENGAGESDIVVSLGQIGVNFLNPYNQAPRDDKTGKIIFGDKKFKDKFTTEWSDYFTSNAEQGTFFDPETFGISNIDVTHNASLTPIIKAEFIDVQGRTLLERGDDPENPYNIFYRFPYPLFTLTIKGYFGKAIEYPLVMTKTSTTFDATTGNYVIRAEFLSKTFSLYNNFLMVYGYVAPYLYQEEGKPNSYLGRKLLKALYQKQNKYYAELYGVDSNEYKKREITNSPTIIDLTRAQKKLNHEELGFNQILTNLNVKRQKVLSIVSDLESAFKQNQISQLKDWKKYLKYDDRDKNNKKYFLSDDQVNKLAKNDWVDLKEKTFQNSGTGFNPYLIYGNLYKETLKKIATDIEDSDAIIKEIFKQVILSEELPKGYRNAVSLRGQNDITNFLIEELVLLEYTNSKNETDLRLIYYTEKYFNVLHKIITKTLSEIYANDENITIEGLTFSLKAKLGYIPNMNNVVRILMNNMQVFLSILNLVALNAYRQIERDEKRRVNQQTFGEYGVTDYSDDKIFYPFPNYYEKAIDPASSDVTWKKTYPGDQKNIGWFEVQFIEELFRAIKKISSLSGVDDSDFDTVEFVEKIISQTATSELNKVVLSSSLLMINNLDYYNDGQTQTETISEFIEKILLYSANSFIHKYGDIGKIDAITKKLADNEFSLLNKKQYNKERDEVGRFYKGIKARIEELGTKKGYDVFMETFVGGTGASDSIIANNQSTVAKIKSLVDTQNYDPADLSSLYDKLLGGIASNGTNTQKYSRLYNYNPLEYSGRKSINPIKPLRSLFFNGLTTHESYAPSNQLIDLSTDIENYLKTNPEGNTGPGYFMYESLLGDYIKKDFPKFNTIDQISANSKNMNGLTQTLKTDTLLNTTTFFDTQQFDTDVLLIDESKKIKDNTTYSKIKI